jgi:hypothetical protein
MLHLSFLKPTLRLLWLILPACLLVSCSKIGPPAPLSLADIPRELKQVFVTASPERKELVDRAVTALENQETVKALQVIEGLCAVPDLTEPQRRVATAALLTLNQELQAAAAKGDARAKQALQKYESTR